MNIFKNIAHGIKVAAVAVAHGFAHLFGQKAAEDFGQASLELLKSALGQIALKEVEALAGVSDISGAEKAVKAQSAILDAAKVAGIDASKSIVNLLIEVAVQFLKNNLQVVVQ